MSEVLDVDLCVVGAGSGGLTIAAGAAQLGLKVVLFERAAMGGDCLNTGCVPSKALLAAAHAAQSMRDAGRFGLKAVEPEVDFGKVMDHVRGVIAAIEPNDSVARFESLGVRVIAAHASFRSPREIEGGGVLVRARRFVLATGSRAVAPPIPGLADTPYFTNETLFDNRALPKHLLIVGAGPIGMEMAQAFRRLGSQVTVLDAGPALAKDDPELTAVVKQALAEEGVVLRERIDIARIERDGEGVAAILNVESGQERIAASHLLVAAGRAPNVEGMGLDVAGVGFDAKKGIAVDKTLRTSNRRVYAVGDCNGLWQFTHMAGYSAALVVKHALFRLPIDVHAVAAPWVTYTDPELAQIGLTEAQARKTHGEAVKILRWPFHDNDRAQAERDTRGFVKVVVGRKGLILGVSIVGGGAGELIEPWAVAMNRKMRVSALAQIVAPYPTRSEVNKRAAGSYYTQALFADRTRRIVRFLFRLPF